MTISNANTQQSQHDRTPTIVLRNNGFGGGKASTKVEVAKPFPALQRALKLDALGYCTTPATTKPTVVDEMSPVKDGEGNAVYDASGNKQTAWQRSEVAPKKTIGKWKDAECGAAATTDRFQKQLGRVLRAAKQYGLVQDDEYLGVAICTAQSGIVGIDLDAGKHPDPNDPSKILDPEAAHDLLLIRMFKMAGLNDTQTEKSLEKFKSLVHARTPSGGWHYPFRRKLGQKPRTSASITLNVDIRGGFELEDGSYESSGLLYAPGNVTTKGEYKVYQRNKDGKYDELETYPAVEDLPHLPDRLASLFEKSTSEQRAIAVELGFPVPENKSNKGRVADNLARRATPGSKASKHVGNTLGGRSVWDDLAEDALITSARTKNPKATTKSIDDYPYWRKALASEIEAVAEMGEGGRNDQIFKSACMLYGLVKAGLIHRAEADKILDAAADACEYLDEEPKECEATLKSAWNSAKARDLRVSNTSRLTDYNEPPDRSGNSAEVESPKSEFEEASGATANVSNVVPMFGKIGVQQKPTSQAGSPPQKLYIEVGAQDIEETSGMIMARVVERNKSKPATFYSNGSLARVKPGGVTPNGDREAPSIEQLAKPQLANELNKVVAFYKTKKGGQDFQPIPEGVLNDIMGAADYPDLPLLRSIRTVPFFDRNGKLVVNSGYHAPSMTYLELPNGLNIPSVPAIPTAEDVRKANNIVVDPLSDFPWGEKPSLFNFIGLNMLPFVRDMIDGPTPIHFIAKPKAGTGSSLLANVHSIITLGYPAAAQPETKDEEEFRKRITSFLVGGNPLFLLDNIRHLLSSGPLASAMTADVWTDRILGKSEMSKPIPVRCTWLFTANNPTFTKELARRMTFIWLDANDANPDKRGGFKYDNLPARLLDPKVRAESIWAYLVLVQNWIAKGKPPGRKTLASFESWARTIGGILEAATGTGEHFLNNRDRVDGQTIDTETSAVDAFIQIWWDTYRNKTIPVGRATALGGIGSGDISGEKDSLCGLLADHVGEIDLGFNGRSASSWAQQMGLKLGHHTNQTFEVATTTTSVDRDGNETIQSTTSKVKLTKSLSNGTKYTLQAIGVRP